MLPFFLGLGQNFEPVNLVLKDEDEEDEDNVITITFNKKYITLQIGNDENMIKDKFAVDPTLFRKGELTGIWVRLRLKRDGDSQVAVYSTASGYKDSIGELTVNNVDHDFTLSGNTFAFVSDGNVVVKGDCSSQLRERCSHSSDCVDPLCGPCANTEMPMP